VWTKKGSESSSLVFFLGRKAEALRSLDVRDAEEAPLVAQSSGV
jgi:hypothetical protein